MEQEGYRMTNKNLQTIQKRVLDIYDYYKSELELLPEDKKSLSNMICFIEALEKVIKIIQEEVKK